MTTIHPFSENLESLRIDNIYHKNPIQTQKEQLNLPFHKFDLTAVSLDWTRFQTRRTTNNFIYYTTSATYFQVDQLLEPATVELLELDEEELLDLEDELEVDELEDGGGNKASQALARSPAVPPTIKS